MTDNGVYTTFLSCLTLILLVVVLGAYRECDHRGRERQALRLRALELHQTTPATAEQDFPYPATDDPDLPVPPRAWPASWHWGPR